MITQTISSYMLYTLTVLGADTSESFQTAPKVDVESFKYLLVCSRSLPDDNSEVDASSISIDISTNNRFYEYAEGQQMNFNCSMIGGIEQKAKITLSIGSLQTKTLSGERMVSLWKLAEVADNDQHVRCEMEHDGIKEPFVMTRILTIFYPPRADAEDLKSGIYEVSGDFRVGQQANLTVRFRANPKPYLADWKANGQELDRSKFQPWTTDQLLMRNGFWEAGLTINKVEQNNFEEEFVLEVTNDYGKATIHAKAQGTLDAKGFDIIFWTIICTVVIFCAVIICFCCWWKRAKIFSCVTGEEIPEEVKNMMEKYKMDQHQLLRKLKLNEAEVSAFQSWQDQCEIPFGFESEEEKIAYALLMQNSISNLCFLKFADLEHVQNKIKATLVVIVSRGDEKRVLMEGTKIVYLGAGRKISKPVVCSLLDESSQTLVKSHKVKFFGNQVTACSVFEKELPSQRINYVLNFECDCDDGEPEISQTSFYINQRISNSSNVFEDIDELVNNISKKQILNYIVVGAAGSGKTKYLDVTKKKLREYFPGFWIVKLSMRALRKPLKELNTLSDAFEVFETALGLDNLKAMLLKSMEERGNCILLLDDFDLAEASQQRFVTKLLKMRKIIVFSRRTDFSAIKDAEIFDLEPLTEVQNKQFISRHLKCSESDTAEILKSFKNLEDFDSGIPLNLLLASEVPLENKVNSKFALVIVYQSYLQQKLCAVTTDKRYLKSILFDYAYNYIVGGDSQQTELHEEAVQETGLVCVKEGVIYFSHRAIAEFLLAEAVWKKIKNEDGADIVMAPEEILTKGKFKQVRYFMDLIAEEFKPVEIHISPVSTFLRSLTSPQKAKVTILEENILILCEVLVKCGASFDFDARLRFSNDGEERFPVIWIATNASADMSDEEYSLTELRLLFLKNRGASFKTKDYCGQTALAIATKARNQKLVDLLINLQSDSESIHLTAKDNSAFPSYKKYFNECIVYFTSKLSNGQLLTSFLAKSNGMAGERNHDTSKDSELFIAVWSGNEGQVKRLVESGADVEATVENRVNSLHIAAQEGNLAIVKLLAPRMRKIDTTDSSNTTALMFATEKGNTDVVKYLLSSRGADVTRVDIKLNTLLHIAVKSQKLELVKLILVQNKIPIDTKNAAGHTALDDAKESELTEIIKFLQRNGAGRF